MFKKALLFGLLSFSGVAFGDELSLERAKTAVDSIDFMMSEFPRKHQLIKDVVNATKMLHSLQDVSKRQASKKKLNTNISQYKVTLESALSENDSILKDLFTLKKAVVAMNLVNKDEISAIEAFILKAETLKKLLETMLKDVAAMYCY